MILKNVLIETGFKKISDKAIETTTQLVSIEIENEKIKNIDFTNSLDGIDMNNYLLLPSFTESHIHLDKGHYGGKWCAVIPANGVFDRIKEEEEFLVEFKKDLPYKAQKILTEMNKLGVTNFNIHVNIDPVIKLDNFNIVKNVLDNNKDKLKYSLIAFPQHGTLKTESLNLLTESLKLDVQKIGSVDPATIDNDIEKSLETTFNLAKKFNKEIDIHLHDRGSLGLYEINRIIYYTKKYEMKGKVAISHAFALGDIDDITFKNTINNLNDMEITINTTCPIAIPSLDWYKALNLGAKVNIVIDNINDHWTPYGTTDILERLSRSSEAKRIVDEYNLSRALKAITQGVTPLNDKGERVWPQIGNDANFCLIKASCSAEAVARFPKERVVIFKGNII